MPSKNRSISSASGRRARRGSTREACRALRSAQEMATMRCCSCGRKSLPLRLALQGEHRLARLPRRPVLRDCRCGRPSSKSGTVSMSNTRKFTALLACSTATATMRPGFVREGDVAFADAEPAPDFLAARGIDHLGLAPGVLHDAHVANPDAMREACAHRLHDGFLRRESHRDESLRPLACASSCACSSGMRR